MQFDLTQLNRESLVFGHFAEQIHYSFMTKLFLSASEINVME